MSTTPNSGWQSWHDERTETWLAKIVLTKRDAANMHPDRLELLQRAGSMIQQAFQEPDKPTPSGEMMRSTIAQLRERLERGDATID